MRRSAQREADFADQAVAVFVEPGAGAEEFGHGRGDARAVGKPAEQDGERPAGVDGGWADCSTPCYENRTSDMKGLPHNRRHDAHDDRKNQLVGVGAV